MGKPAARLTDFHACPMVTPGVPPIPHVGGPIIGSGCLTVLIAGMPAAVMGDQCMCTGPPDVAILGSTGVFIGKKMALRMGDSTAHGGTIVAGAPTVLIGEMKPGGPPAPLPPSVANMVNNMKSQAKSNQPGGLSQIFSGSKGKFSSASFSSSLSEAAQNNSPFIHACEQC